MKAQSYELVSGFVFTLVAVIQLLRFVFRWEIIAQGHLVPLWPSALAFVVAGFLAFQGLKLSGRKS